MFGQLTRASLEQLRNCAFSKYFSFTNYCFHSFEAHVCNYNWKTFIEVYLDDYHVNPFHPGLGNFVDCNKLKWVFCDSFSVQAVGALGLLGANSSWGEDAMARPTFVKVPFVMYDPDIVPLIYEVVTLTFLLTLI